MDSRFKFRAWIEEVKSYFYFDLYDIKKHTFDEIEEENIEQCVGLEDKNGELIYEGDILRFVYDWEEEIKPVVFDIESACYGVKYCKDFILPFANNLQDIEVIGNIHENKDLLEDNND